MLRAAELADIAFIRGLAGRPDNAPFLTDEDETALAAYLTDPKAKVLIWGKGAARGFAIFTGVGSLSRTVCLMRLALDEPGRGEGRAFVAALIDHGFCDLNARKLWLDTSGENLRAQRVYARAGFVLEGRLRQHDHVPRIGRVVDTLLYGMLRDEWAVLPR